VEAEQTVKLAFAGDDNFCIRATTAGDEPYVSIRITVVAEYAHK